MAQPPNANELISQFMALTQATTEVASNHLILANWDLEAAVQEFFASQDEPMGGGAEEEEEEEEEEELAAVPGGGRTLGGEGVPSRRVPASDAPSAGDGGGGGGSSSAAGGPKKKFGSLRDLAGGNPAPPSASDDEDDDPDLYAGGEKSGLAVQNPDDLRRKIIEKAKKQAAEGGLPSDDGPSRRSNFSGRAQTLGGDDAPSRVIDDPEADAPQPLARVQRTLHFWENGFSVDDGPLYHKDDPANQARLEMIQRGRAPYDILNVEHNQEADVKLEQHDGPYVQPKKKYVPFSGQGQRLGSPTPGVSGIAAPPPQPAAAAPSSSTSAPAASAAQPNVDTSQPTVRIQIRLADGTRLVSSFNTTHTVGDVYSFVSASNAASQSRSWVLATTFPNKDLNDKALVIADSPELKKGGAIVQKWA